jgi:hypothetical protein
MINLRFDLTVPVTTSNVKANPLMSIKRVSPDIIDQWLIWVLLSGLLSRRCIKYSIKNPPLQQVDSPTPS